MLSKEEDQPERALEIAARDHSVAHETLIEAHALKAYWQRHVARTLETAAGPDTLQSTWKSPEIIAKTNTCPNTRSTRQRHLRQSFGGTSIKKKSDTAGCTASPPSSAKAATSQAAKQDHLIQANHDYYERRLGAAPTLVNSLPERLLPKLGLSLPTGF